MSSFDDNRLAGNRDDGGDLAARVTAKVVGTVDRLNRVTARPLTIIARALVYGLLGAVLGLTVLVLLTIGALRLLDVYLPGEVWSAYLALGSIFTLGGLVLWRKRKPATR